LTRHLPRFPEARQQLSNPFTPNTGASSLDVHEAKSLSLCADFFLISVMQVGLAKHDGGNARLVGHNAFDPIG
jgi:hypothetical protein